MTTNQINFAKLKEDQRFNDLTHGWRVASLSEESRRNLENERINWYTAHKNYEIGTKQANASAAQAAASMANAQAAQQQAAVRAQELRQKQYEYETTGKSLAESTTAYQNASARWQNAHSSEQEYSNRVTQMVPSDWRGYQNYADSWVSSLSLGLLNPNRNSKFK